MNPVNLYAFFENYKAGDYHSIQKRFSLDFVDAPLSYECIDVLMEYMLYVQDSFDKELSLDNVGGSRGDEMAAFGSLWATAIHKSYDQVYDAMDRILPVRYF